ncbi:MAG: 50S ribosomal protein L25 [Desulfovibrionaceae bacterium]|nr:50S ribosomal protein L25 [Desulfovibrionaceae bacterium]
MSEKLTFKVQLRTDLGKGANRRLREKGLVPGVFYTPSGENMPIQVDNLSLQKLAEAVGRTILFNIEIEGAEKPVIHESLIWSYQHHPYRKMPQHFDILGVDPDKEIKLDVPLEYVGTAKGTKVGGKLEVYHKLMTIITKPASLPDKIRIDVSELNIGEDLRAANVPLPEGVRRYSQANYAVVGVISTRASAAAEGAA